MKTVTECISYLSTHPWLKKGYAKLKKEEVALLTSFLENSSTDKGQAMDQVNRMFLDKKTLPKNWTTISELASSAVTYRFQ